MSEAPQTATDTSRLYLDLLTSAQYPIYCKPVQKAGCTTIKNVFHYLDHGRWLDDPQSIHKHQRDLLKFTDYDVSAADVAASGRGFAVVRTPVDRLLSFYFDKLVTTSTRAADMPWVVTALTEQYRFIPDADLGIEHHRFNLMRVMDFIEDCIKGRTLLRKDPHWMPQYRSLKKVAAAKLTVIPLEHMAAGIDRLVGDVVPGIGDLFAAAPRFNETRWQSQVDREALIADPLIERIRATFFRDFRIHRRAIRNFQNG